MSKPDVWTLRWGAVGLCAVSLACGAAPTSARSTAASGPGGGTDDTDGDADGDDDDAGTSRGDGDDDTPSTGDPGQGGPHVAFVSPADGATLDNPVTFEVVGSEVSRVEMIVDSTEAVMLGWDPSASVGHTFTHAFATLGAKDLELRGFDGDDAKILASASLSIVVEGEAQGGDTSGDTGDGPPAACDGFDAEPFVPPTSCDGPTGTTSTQVPQNGKFATSWFGCYEQSDGSIYQDPYDNCEFACGNQGLCPAGQDGPTCEANLKWFAADADRYGCGGRIRVTHCVSGKSVVLVTLDRGPHCSTVEQACSAPVLDMSHDAMVHLFDGNIYGGCDHQAVYVEEVAADTPLGPG